MFTTFLKQGFNDCYFERVIFVLAQIPRTRPSLRRIRKRRTGPEDDCWIQTLTPRQFHSLPAMIRRPTSTLSLRQRPQTRRRNDAWRSPVNRQTPRISHRRRSENESRNRMTAVAKMPWVIQRTIRKVLLERAGRTLGKSWATSRLPLTQEKRPERRRKDWNVLPRDKNWWMNF